MSFKTLHIGTTALMTSQLALNTVGHNVANAATPGYTRQRLFTEAEMPDQKTFGALGSGTKVRVVKRISDEFLEQQVREAGNLYAHYEAMINSYENLEAVFNELTENDLSTAFDDFWNSINDVTNHAEDVSTRRALIEQAQVMTEAFNALDSKLRDMRDRIDNLVVDTVDNINSLVEDIAHLNQEITRSEYGGQSDVMANDARDRRTERLKELAEILDIMVTEESNGSVVVSIRGRLLVQENQFFTLDTETEVSDDLLVNEPVFTDDRDEVEPGPGQLGSYVAIRDEILYSYKQDLDELAGVFLWEFNRVHSQGQGVRGFETLTSTVSVNNPTATLDQIEYDFAPVGGTYEIRNGNLEVQVKNEVTGEITTTNIEIDLDGTGEPDMIFYDSAVPVGTSNNAFVNGLYDALNDSFPGVFDVSVDSTNRVTIESNNEEFTFGFGRDTSGILAATGLNTFFSGHDAGTIAVEDFIRENPGYMAGSQSFNAGDNSNLVDLLSLRETGIFDDDESSADDFYQGIIGRLGIEFKQTKSLLETQEDIVLRTENQREDLSGVNIDEELTMMIQFQRTFQSAARFITAANAIYDALIRM
jgi:flagellar hook-associated protein 1